jgi:hypothetical protein
VASDPTEAKAVDAAQELAREQAEVRRLRELLVTRDAELGVARGRTMELEARARYVLGAMRRLRALPRLATRFREPRS